MDGGTVLLACIATGLLLGAISSAITRLMGMKAGVTVGLAVAVLGLTVIAVHGTSAIFPAVGAMLAFSVAASLLDPRPGGMFR